jgi:allene oxide cyclase-like protein
VRTKIRFSVALLAIVALGVVVPGSALAGSKHGGKDTLRLTATEIQSEFLDLGSPGPSLGDELVFSERLSQNGREVGESGVVCVVTHTVPPYDVLTFHCVGTLSLRKGQITLQGLIEVQGPDDPGPFLVAITGGTGKFRGAGGEALVRNRSDGTSVYKLSFDSRDNHDGHHRH